MPTRMFSTPNKLQNNSPPEQPSNAAKWIAYVEWSKIHSKRRITRDRKLTDSNLISINSKNKTTLLEESSIGLTTQKPGLGTSANNNNLNWRNLEHAHIN